MANLPTGIGTGRFRAKIVQGILDTQDDADDLPDAVPPAGTIKATATGAMFTYDPEKTLVIPGPFTMTLENGVVDEFLPALPEGWTYRLEFAVIGVSIPAINVPFQKDADIQLSDWMPNGVAAGTVVPVLRGAQGFSAYDIAVQGGYTGTITQWVASLKGIQGDKGFPGATGAQGTPGTGTVTTPVLSKNFYKNPELANLSSWNQEANTTITLLPGQGRNGHNAFQVEHTSSGAAVSAATYLEGLTVGTVYTVSVYTERVKGSEGFFIVTSGGTTIAADQLNPGIAPKLLYVTFRATETYVTVYHYNSRAENGNASQNIGSAFKISEPMLNEGYKPESFFHGNEPGCYYVSTGCIKALYDADDVVRVEQLPALDRNLWADGLAALVFGAAVEDSAHALFGPTAIKITPGAASYSGTAWNNHVGANAINDVSGDGIKVGRRYTWSAWFYSEVDRDLNLAPDWMSVEAIGSEGNGGQYGGSSNAVRLNANGWARYSFTGTATSLNPQYVRNNAAPEGTPFWVDGWMVTETPNPVDYFDGDTPGCRWTRDRRSIKSLPSRTDEQRNLYGRGLPEGRVAAPVGTRYTDRDATNGAIEWIKATGEGSTGWRVVYGDTGSRNLTSLLLNGFAEASNFGRVRLSRIGNLVELSLRFDSRAKTSDTFLDVPVGFRPITEYATFRMTDALNPFSSGYMDLFQDRDRLRTNVSSAFASSTASWFTRDPWPTTLPGTAV